jgi:exodeoxyribonuclease VII small subunit
VSNEEQLVEDLPFEAALSELEQIVEELESGQVELDRMLERFERAMELRKHCASLLAAAEKKIEQLVSDEGDTETFEPNAAPDPIAKQNSGDVDWAAEDEEDPFGDK